MVHETLYSLEEYIQPGITSKNLDTLAEDFIRARGFLPAFKGYMGYPATLCISVNDEVVHGIPGDRELVNGDIVSIDCGVVKDGYFGDSAWTFSVGQISKSAEDLLEVTENSLHKGIVQAVEGNHVSDIGHAIQQYVEAEGFSVVRELVGHGIGTQLHEDPQIPNFGSPGQGVELKAGMCLAIEPMINLGVKEIYTKSDGWTVCTRDGKPSAHFEHTIVITKNGAKILSDGSLNGR